MGVKQGLRRGARRLGVDVSRYRGDPSALLRQRLLVDRSVDLVLDVGANIGQYGLGLRQAGYTGRILSFEPVSSARAQLLRRTVDDPLWEVSEFALGSSSGAATINVAGNEAASSSLLPMLPSHSRAAPEADYVGTEEVEVRRLDELGDLVGAARRIHLKMDVQGLEGEVLDGSSALALRLIGIEMELSFVPLYEGGLDHRAAFDRMASAGYTLKQLFPGFRDPRTQALLQADAIFYRDEESTSR